ncbi:MAG: DUF72 domain-containing protein [Deltaproteobacteria bacterium]|nr:DUF72 domain-containing protein [Deltaproteobacteria bacterium]
MSQLDLFGAPPPPPATPKVGPAPQAPELHALAGRLPPQLHLGTSSWSFPGWAGFVWDREASEAVLAKEGLSAYAQHPLFRTVGVDRTYYAPVTADVFRRYAEATPSHFKFLVKAAEACALARFPHHPRYGAQRGQENPRFLDAAWATDAVVQPFVEGLGDKGGPLVFQFPPQEWARLGGEQGFLGHLDRFLGALPRGPLYAVEVRNPGLLGPDLAAVLQLHGAVPVLSAWGNLPDVTRQAGLLSALERQALVVRWMLPPGVTYEEAKSQFEPFSRLAEPDPGTRGRIADLVRAFAQGNARPAWVIVNNKAEGSSPLSVVELAREVAREAG